MNILARKDLIQSALGQPPADLYIQNGRLLNVYSGEILDDWNIVVKGRSIAYISSAREIVGPATTVILNGFKIHGSLQKNIDKHDHL